MTITSTTSTTSTTTAAAEPIVDHELLTWVAVCVAARVVPDRGVAALVDGEPVAIFRLTTSDPAFHEWRAVSHRDPLNGMPVIARGLVGSINLDGVVVPTVASPLLKQRYDLRTGQCLDDARLALDTYAIRMRDGVVEVGSKSPS